MRRNQPSRSKRKSEHRDRPAAERPKNAERSSRQPSQEPLEASSEASSTPKVPLRGFPFGLALRVCLAAVVVVFCGLIAMQIALRWRADSWPTTHDVGLMPILGAAGAGLLVVASLAAWLARKLAQSNKRTSARATLCVALVCAGLFVGLRSYEYRELHATGLWRRSTAGPIHESADLYYMQAVRLRLTRLFGDLENRRVNQSSEFSDEDARKLELVTNLQTNMVAWTENEVGHWSDDLRQRRDAMALVAYQVHPLAVNQAEVSVSLRQQLVELDRQRQWFRLLRDYCQAKSELLGQLNASPEAKPASRETSAAASGDVAGSRVGNVGNAQALIDLERAWKQKLASLGLTDWPYARSIIVDSGDPAMAPERLNQIAARLDAMDARAAFLNESEQAILKDDPAAGGLNRMHRWLRLPICLPGGNAWASGFFALTSLHLLLLGVVVVMSLGVLLLRFDAANSAPWRNAQWWWYVFSLTGIAMFLLFYAF